MTTSAFGVELDEISKAKEGDSERAAHYGRMSGNMTALGATAGTVGAGSAIVGHAERSGRDPMGFTERPGKKPMTPRGRARVLKPFSEAHAYQAKTLGRLAGASLALGGAYKLKQRQERSAVGKSDDARTRRRRAGDVGLGAASATVGGSTLAFGMKNSHMLNQQANIGGAEARGAHHLIAGEKTNGWGTSQSELDTAKRVRRVGARVFAVKKPAAILAAGAAAAGGASLVELGRHAASRPGKTSSPIRKVDEMASAFDVELGEVSKDWRRPIAGPMSHVADHNAKKFDRKAERKAKKGDEGNAGQYRRLASRSRTEARQYRQIKDGQPVSKSAFGVDLTAEDVISKDWHDFDAKRQVKAGAGKLKHHGKKAVERNGLTGTPGDKRNTKYAAAAAGYGALGSLVGPAGTAAGAAAGTALYSRQRHSKSGAKEINSSRARAAERKADRARHGASLRAPVAKSAFGVEP